MKPSNSPGGKRLRTLREYYGRTQLDVELEANLGIGYLQRVEVGKVQQPERDTLERILAALDASYTDRRDILELFGYVVDAPLPTEDEIQWAIEVYRAEIDSAVFPAYLLDCAHRLLSWNPLITKLFRLDGDSVYQPVISRRVSMLRVVFDPVYQVALWISNPDVFFPAQIRALRYEMQWFREEPWYQVLLAEIEPFAQDRRFRVLYYLPAEPKTMQQCLLWVQSSGVSA
jgi:transcriptional regulator with XRE-family HTH domain